jgi:pyruvate carboxylase
VKLQAKVLKDVKPVTERPGAHIPAADLGEAEKEVQAKIGRPLEGNELLSYLMYPKVFIDYAALQNRYGPVSVLPTPVFFYGMKPGEEIAIELERGKSLVVRLQTISETDEEGKVRVFFELNGQPRIVKVPDRSAKSTVEIRRKAEEGNDTHVAAPMPGAISTVAVKKGEKVKAGDVLLTIEAMKMETALHAGRDGVVTELLVAPGAQIDAKDLLLVLG